MIKIPCRIKAGVDIQELIYFFRVKSSVKGIEKYPAFRSICKVIVEEPPNSKGVGFTVHRSLNNCNSIEYEI
jgi:hypothetical protein